MTDSGSRGKKPPTLVEGFNHVPNILEEARRAVDEVTPAPPNQGGGRETPAPKRGAPRGVVAQKAASRKKSAPGGGRQKKPSRPPAPPQPAAPRLSEVATGPRLSASLHKFSNVFLSP